MWQEICGELELKFVKIMFLLIASRHIDINVNNVFYQTFFPATKPLNHLLVNSLMSESACIKRIFHQLSLNYINVFATDRSIQHAADRSDQRILSGVDPRADLILFIILTLYSAKLYD